jgi:hypothetical protein
MEKELPGLRGELDSMMVSTVEELELRGQTRATIQDQRPFLTKICEPSRRSRIRERTRSRWRRSRKFTERRMLQISR